MKPPTDEHFEQPNLSWILSEREIEIAEQVWAGKSNKEIAAIFRLSPKTVDSHLGSVYKKLNCQARGLVLIVERWKSAARKK